MKNVVLNNGVEMPILGFGFSRSRIWPSVSEAFGMRSTSVIAYSIRPPLTQRGVGR